MSKCIKESPTATEPGESPVWEDCNQLDFKVIELESYKSPSIGNGASGIVAAYTGTNIIIS